MLSVARYQLITHNKPGLMYDVEYTMYNLTEPVPNRTSQSKITNTIYDVRCRIYNVQFTEAIS